MKRNRQVWEAEVSDAVKRDDKEHAIKILDHDFLFAEVPDRLHMLQIQFDLVASNEEKVAVLDKQFRLAASNEEKVAVLDWKFDLVASNQEKVAVLDRKFDLVASNEEKVAVLDRKFDLVASNEEKVAVLDKQFRLAASNEEKVAVLDKKFDLLGAEAKEELTAGLTCKLGILRTMLDTNKSSSLLLTKIDVISRLAPLVPDERSEALHQESKRAAADLDHLRPFHDKQHFIVCGIIKNSRRIKGIRATLYKHAQTLLAFYPGDGALATYIGEDLHICAAFETNMKAMKFQNFLEQLHLDSPLLSLKDRIVVQDEISLQTISSPRRVRLHDYDPNCSDSPPVALSDLQASTASVDSTVDLHSEEYCFQRLEDEKVFAAFNSRPYIMHLKPQAAFPTLRKQSYNRLAATWVFHQNFDGLHTLDQLPGLAVRAREDSSKDCPEVIAGQPRTRVELLVEFRSAAAAESLHLKEGSTRIAPDQWATFVHVSDAARFRECLAWKYEQTRKAWRDADTPPGDSVSDLEEDCENLVPAAVVAADVAGAE